MASAFFSNQVNQSPMSLQDYLSHLQHQPVVTCTPSIAGGRLSLSFSIETPTGPGVYIVYQRTPEKPFYIGEAGNLLQRLKYLFSCYRNENPHPCHRRHKEVYEVMPEVSDFCALYSVRWLSTAGQVGRLEIEEALQKTFGTNRKEFYLNFDPEAKPAPVVPPAAPPVLCTGCCDSSAPCTDCPVWKELSENKTYSTKAGIEIPTMGGRAASLLFRFDPDNTQVRVWRPNGRPDFTFGVTHCHALCRRYRLGLKDGVLPPPNELGGTGYFTDPDWPTPVLGRIKTPYAAAVIRYVWLTMQH